MIISEPKVLIDLLKRYKLGIIPTDTVYGFSCRWDDEENIRKIFAIKKRSFTKPVLVLVASLAQLEKFIDVSDSIRDYLTKLTSPTTIIFPIKKGFVNDFWKEKIAIRFVQWTWLQEIILAVGPIVSTSCNISNQKPAINFEDLFSFRPNVDFIFEKPTQSQIVSTMIDWESKKKLR